MEAVRKFLSEKGLSRYEKEFEENGYDNIEVLEGLDSEDFDELAKVVGLKPGHKVALRKALQIPGTLSITLLVIPLIFVAVTYPFAVHPQASTPQGILINTNIAYLLSYLIYSISILLPIILVSFITTCITHN